MSRVVRYAENIIASVLASLTLVSQVASSPPFVRLPHLSFPFLLPGFISSFLCCCFLSHFVTQSLFSSRSQMILLLFLPAIAYSSTSFSVLLFLRFFLSLLFLSHLSLPLSCTPSPYPPPLPRQSCPVSPAKTRLSSRGRMGTIPAGFHSLT